MVWNAFDLFVKFHNASVLFGIVSFHSCVLCYSLLLVVLSLLFSIQQYSTVSTSKNDNRLLC